MHLPNLRGNSLNGLILGCFLFNLSVMCSKRFSAKESFPSRLETTVTITVTTAIMLQ